MKRQGGFTLIELVVVIVILGILAVTAAPKFLNLQGDAREASIQGLRGAINGATGIVYGKAAIEGKEQTNGSSTEVKTDDEVTISFGYPTAEATGITKALTLDTTNEWRVAYDTTEQQTRKAVFTLQAVSLGNGDDDLAKIRATECYVEYTEATENAEPTITVDKDKC